MILSLILTMIATFTPQANAKTLKEMGLSCTSAERELEPKPTLSSHAKALEALTTEHPDIFQFARVRVLREQAGALRDDLSSSHLNNHLRRTFARLRKQQSQSMAEGTLKPVAEGETYPKSELKKRLRSIHLFRRQHLEPALREAYDFFLTTAVQRPLKRVPRALVELANQQREVLNRALRELAPHVVEVLGEIPPATSHFFPFSYRDGYIVKLRLKRPDCESCPIVTLYPRLLQTQVAGEDAYFIKALETWRDFTLRKRDEVKRRGFRRQMAARLADQADKDFTAAKRIGPLLNKLTDEDLTTLLDLFRGLLAGNRPQCQRIITELNRRMGEQIRRRDVQRELATDVVFYQDLYEVL